MKKVSTTIILSLLAATMAPNLLYSQSKPVENAAPVVSETENTEESEAPVRLEAKTKAYSKVEKDLETTTQETSATGKEALIETSHPYLLPRLFTIPTAYSLQSYEVRFGGQGNIHTIVSNMNTENMKGSLSLGLGGIIELGYQLDEYYTVQDISDKMLMGYFKLGMLRESEYLPAASISASKNLRSTFHTPKSHTYLMDEDQYELVLSKAFHMGNSLVSFHPGVQLIRDRVSSIDGIELAELNRATKYNPRLGISWQSRPKLLFMYEFKSLHPTDISQLSATRFETHQAVENNLGVRYYIRNWLCIDSGIRHYYDTKTYEDEMKIHANFVGVIPMATVYDRVQNYFKH